LEIPRWMWDDNSEHKCNVVVDSRADQMIDDFYVPQYIDGYMSDSNYGMLMTLQGLTVYSLYESIQN